MGISKYRKLQDKHVLIIGGTSGIGFAVAEASLADGAHVTVSSSSPAKVSNAVLALKNEYPGQNIQGYPCDLSQPTVEDDLEALFSIAEAAQGTIHHIVLTAGSFPGLHPINTIDVATINGVGESRVVAAVMLGKIAGRHLPKDNSSSLTLTNGAVSEQPSKGFAVMAYVAGGLQALGRALAVELAPIRVNVVRPGLVETPMMSVFGEEAKQAMKKMAEKKMATGKVGQPEDVAEAYLWLMKDKNVTMAVAATDGGYVHSG